MVHFALILSVISVGLVIFKPKQGILFLLVAKPFIDTTWDASFGGMKVAYITGGVVPVVMIFHYFARENKEFKADFVILWAIYSAYNLLTSLIIVHSDPKAGFENFFKALSGFSGYLMFLTFFSEKEDFRKLLVALLIAGIFPMGQGLYQLLTGHVWKEWTAEGGMRNIGMYHDQAVLKYCFFQTIAAILLYWTYFCDSQKGKYILSAYFTVCIPVLYKLYIKSGYIEFALWIFLWFFLQKQKKLLFLIALVVFGLNIILANKIVTDIGSTYKKEIGVMEGDLSYEWSFAGRWFGWVAWIENWKDTSMFKKLFGVGRSGGGLHSDYLYVLSKSGIIGLLLYIVLLCSVGFKLFERFLKNATPMTTIGIMIFSLWMIETIGLVPSFYPSFQWFAWGLIGLSLNNMFDTKPDDTNRPLSPFAFPSSGPDLKMVDVKP